MNATKGETADGRAVLTARLKINMATLIYSTLTQLATANFAPLLISWGGGGGRPDMLKAIRSLIDNESCSSWAP